MSESTAAAPGFGGFFDEPPLSPAAPQGLRLARPAPAPPAPTLPTAPVAFATPAPAEPELVVEEPLPAAATAAEVTVYVRLSTGERIAAGSFADSQTAQAAGRDLASKFAMDGSWPFLDGRFVRPDAVVTIDLD